MKLSNSLKALKDPAAFNFILESLKFSYGQYGIPPYASELILNTLHGNLDLLDFSDRQTRLIELIRADLNKNSNIFLEYERYKKEIKPEVTCRILAPFIEEKLKNKNSKIEIADIGCGNNALAFLIAKKYPKALISGTDVLDYSLSANSQQVSFVQQTSPAKIPLPKNKFDLVLLVSSLHHVDPSQVENFLKQIKSLLKDDGSVLLVEDSFSLVEKPIENPTYLWEKFLSIDNELKITTLNVIDWIGVALIPKGVGMNIPFYFKSAEDWSLLLKEQGFRIQSINFLGFVRGRFHLNPQVLLEVGI